MLFLLEVRRERWWARAAAASGNMAWIVLGSRWRELRGEGETGGAGRWGGLESKESWDIAEFSFCCMASESVHIHNVKMQREGVTMPQEMGNRAIQGSHGIRMVPFSKDAGERR